MKEKIMKKIGQLGWLFALLTSVLLFVMMEIANRNNGFFSMEGKYILINVGTYFSLLLLVWLICGKWSVGCGLWGMVLAVLGIVNLYTLEFREMPISTRDLQSIKTAGNVLGAYEITLNKRVIFLMLAAVFLVAASVVLGHCERTRKKRTRRQIGIRALAGVLGIGAFFYVCYFGSSPLVPAEGLGWSWEGSYYAYGFMSMSVKTAKQSFYKVQEPEGFAEVYVDEYRQELTASQGTETPDIILILNESWYDFSLIADIETNEEITPFIDSLENCVRGYAVVPGVGGTNFSEYELLTGNSMQLTKGITPFNSLYMGEMATSVTVLEEQGYETTAFHPAPKQNYSRSIAYSDMGFDHIFFEDNVEGLKFWAQRTAFATDASDFSILTQIYEENIKDGDNPQFLYNLTIQNHGGYALVSADKVPVQVTGGLDGMDEWSILEMNEYLSCLQMTDRAFEDLIAYFENVERPVILCMVGDHCPKMAPEFVTKDLTEEEENLYLHSTPFLIWSNMNLEASDEGFISMSYVVPTLLEKAGVSLSPYYRFITEDLKTEVPVVTSFDLYLDRNGNQYTYSQETEYTSLVNEYLYLEYWNLQGNKEDALYKSVALPGN